MNDERSAMGKYYLFGAGINGVAAIKFFKRKNIIAVIDNDERKQGKQMEGIPIISLNQYINRADNKQIIISGFTFSGSITDNLKEKGIFHYYISPYMQTGFYEDCQDIIFKLKLYQYKKICFISKSPMSELIEEGLRENKINVTCSYIEKEKINVIENDAPIIITNYEEKIKAHEICSEKQRDQILDINEIYEKNFGFKNDRLLKFENIHRGERCFIIGNGPSLRYSDLDTLHRNKEICFGVNRIYFAYEHTNWRPNYYVAVDYIIVQNDKKKLMELEGTKFIRHFYKTVENWADNNIYEFRGMISQSGKPEISLDMYQGIYIGNTVVYDAIQIALYMGFREIYLLGVDMTSGVRSEDNGVHFYKSPNPLEGLGIGNISNAQENIEYAAKVIEELGGKLRNATRGGELNKVIRVDFDEFFDLGDDDGM